ncbi:MAG TPA: hypothetical protein VFP72_23800 [Kineosporiaceae bacterium]|nr:hypothetical protein [Kineosporiaceae bacterium]
MGPPGTLPVIPPGSVRSGTHAPVPEAAAGPGADSSGANGSVTDGPDSPDLRTTVLVLAGLLGAALLAVLLAVQDLR